MPRVVRLHGPEKLRIEDLPSQPPGHNKVQGDRYPNPTLSAR